LRSFIIITANTLKRHRQMYEGTLAGHVKRL